jgi:rhamnosyltransferase
MLYNPEISMLDNLNSYLCQVDWLFVVDNSEVPNATVVQRLEAVPGVSYFSNGGNLGVASALNKGAELALAAGYAYLLTMDQDSMARPGMVAALLNCFEDDEFGQRAMAAPLLVANDSALPGGTPHCEEILFAMTSGCLLKLEAYTTSGPFMDDLFVDYVDIEYSMRLCRDGHTLVRSHNALLEHRVGHQLPVAGSFTITTHSPIRMYYKTRNRLLIWNWYGSIFPGFCWVDRLRIWREIFRLLLFEPDKWEKLKMMVMGIRDFRSGKMGKYVP